MILTEEFDHGSD